MASAIVLTVLIMIIPTSILIVVGIFFTMYGFAKEYYPEKNFRERVKYAYDMTKLNLQKAEDKVRDFFRTIKANIQFWWWLHHSHDPKNETAKSLNPDFMIYLSPANAKLYSDTLIQRRDRVHQLELEELDAKQ